MFSSYPDMLRNLARSNPDLLTGHQGGAHQKLTKLQASLRAAVAQAQEFASDPLKEKADRLTAAQRAYCLELARKGGRLPRLSDRAKEDAVALVKAREILTHAEFNPLTYEIKPVGFDTFGAVLERRNLRYTINTSPHPCPICEGGPVHTVVLEAKNAERDALAVRGESIPGTLTALIRFLTEKVKKYQLHLTSLAVNSPLPHHHPYHPHHPQTHNHHCETNSNSIHLCRLNGRGRSRWSKVCRWARSPSFATS
jgi:hypothetical protein